MKTPQYERIFTVSINDLDKYIDTVDYKYIVLKYCKDNNSYIVGEIKNNSIAQ